MTHETDTAPERIWAEPFTMVPAGLGLWVATAQRPDYDSLLVEYVRADVVAKARTTAEVNYNQLIYAVASKHPGENRFETALRHIKNAERGSCQSEVGQEGA